MADQNGELEASKKIETNPVVVVAGIGQMSYRRFVVYNVIGGAIWVSLLVPLGYFFAGNEFVQKRFELVILAIVFLSVLPMLIEIARGMRAKDETAPEGS